MADNTANAKPHPTLRIIEPTIRRPDQCLDTDRDANIAVRKLRVAAYARVSTNQDEQQSSLEAQKKYYTDFIIQHPHWEFVGIFADEGITGTSTKRREQFMKMIDLALEQKIDVIFTKSISRFARNTLDTIQTVRELKSKGVEVIFEKENIHTLDPKSELLLTILSSLAQDESRSLSENIRWGIRKNMQDGKVCLPYKKFLGYQKGLDGRPEIVESEAEVVRAIYDLFLKGRSLSRIAQALTEDEVPTPGGKVTWSVSTVRSILSNEKYKGEALLQKTYRRDYLDRQIHKNNGELPQYLVHDSHAPIIAPAVFDRVQRELARRRTIRTKTKGIVSPFANRLVCGTCGAFFGHKVWRSRGKTRTRHDIWCCNHRYAGEKRCTTPLLREDEIRTAFENVLKELGLPQTAWSQEVWYEMVDEVIIHENRQAEFYLVSGSKISVGI